MQTELDMKDLYKALTITLSSSQKRLLYAISRAPTAHLYTNQFMTEFHLSRGGIESGLRRLIKLDLVGRESGIWQLQPPELRIWLKAVHENGPHAAESLRWAKFQPKRAGQVEESGRSENVNHDRRAG
ncbi:hypothetical protein [Geomonas oryzae]|uniref:hypothetical protein n=1 Tax=Geomonas oryzae TaxID=2364273 RepID=UPI00100A657A|nr:hypothetical protein [Geomonas oryzae]